MCLFLISIEISSIYKEALSAGLTLLFFKQNFKERHWEIQWILHGIAVGISALSKTEILPNRKSSTPFPISVV